jgi:hypothetical protein
MDAPVVDSINCMCLTDERGKFLVAGMKGGHLMIYNRVKGGKKVVEDVMKRNQDVVDVIDLEGLDSKYFLVQDDKSYIRMFSADFLYYDLKEDHRIVPLIDISQKGSMGDSMKDTNYGDNKLLELMNTDF